MTERTRWIALAEELAKLAEASAPTKPLPKVVLSLAGKAKFDELRAQYAAPEWLVTVDGVVVSAFAASWTVELSYDDERGPPRVTGSFRVATIDSIDRNKELMISALRGDEEMHIVARVTSVTRGMDPRTGRP